MRWDGQEKAVRGPPSGVEFLAGQPAIASSSSHLPVLNVGLWTTLTCKIWRTPSPCLANSPRCESYTHSVDSYKQPEKLHFPAYFAASMQPCDSEATNKTPHYRLVQRTVTEGLLQDPLTGAQWQHPSFRGQCDSEVGGCGASFWL